MIEEVAFDLNVTCSKHVRGDRGGDVEQEQGTEGRLLVKVRRWWQADFHEASWSSRAC
jgi:hypothetical protein